MAAGERMRRDSGRLIEVSFHTARRRLGGMFLVENRNELRSAAWEVWRPFRLACSIHAGKFAGNA
jgi:hypothetical protein